MLIIFIIQCLMIFIDRWIYLRRHVVAKLIFQFVQIIAIHFCLFLLLPAATFRYVEHILFVFQMPWPSFIENPKIKCVLVLRVVQILPSNVFQRSFYPDFFLFFSFRFLKERTEIQKIIINSVVFIYTVYVSNFL